MLQIVYISSAVGSVDTAPILDTSRRNNARDGVTGLLYADGRRFLQALEGEPHMVEAAFARIIGDPRHRAIVMLSQREVETREFGAWAMAERAPAEADEAALMARIASLIAGAEPAVKATFESFARLRRAA
ncbi:BLUF domain-containing protein [Sphingomonas endophytica]|uniref:Activator of photopigment and puc with BLUF domain protein n=1 Tax=Sphingomonas endophytica TaxID=869719 RepID=A0A147I9L3_9SPHN|nr:BLUF domain-containing protein [Sphingomonas endophytica]KTT76264.1 activator of photopigment and puc with BLUF domain protein [Sphingomonas endophytica]